MGRKRKAEARSYIVRVREVVIREYVVDALDEQEARENFHRSNDVRDVETVDWEVENVEENV